MPPENSVRVKFTGPICDNQMTDSGERLSLSGWKASFVAAKSGADNRRKCLQNMADGVFGRDSRGPGPAGARVLMLVVEP